MWLRREPNNRSKPTNLASIRVSQRESPGEFCDFYALIMPDFLMDFLSELVEESGSESVGCELETIRVS